MHFYNILEVILIFSTQFNLLAYKKHLNNTQQTKRTILGTNQNYKSKKGYLYQALNILKLTDLRIIKVSLFIFKCNKTI